MQLKKEAEIQMASYDKLSETFARSEQSTFLQNTALKCLISHQQSAINFVRLYFRIILIS